MLCILCSGIAEKLKGSIMAVKQTAGRDQLGDFAPQFAQLNDDVLFGEVWAREDELDLKTCLLYTSPSPRDTR